MTEFLSVVEALGAEEAGSFQHWKETVETWAAEWDAAVAKAEMEANRFNPDYRPTAEQDRGQAAAMAMLGGPAPRREETTK